jgi:hypothetical protein
VEGDSLKQVEEEPWRATWVDPAAAVEEPEPAYIGSMEVARKEARCMETPS